MYMETTETAYDLEGEIERPLSNRLTNADRCDQCGAQALVWVIMPDSDAGLMYCRHHFMENEDGLRKVAVDFIDETWKLSVPR